uniref:Uncharacterized protein n=1 Tax=Rhodnius prolixus TaxID=13249 RepID=T1HGF6_RHOPR
MTESGQTAVFMNLGWFLLFVGFNIGQPITSLAARLSNKIQETSFH